MFEFVPTRDSTVFGAAGNVSTRYAVSHRWIEYDVRIRRDHHDALKKLKQETGRENPGNII